MDAKLVYEPLGQPLAYWTAKMGNPAKALDLYQQVYDTQLRVLGDNHPDTLTLRRNIVRLAGEAADENTLGSSAD